MVREYTLEPRDFFEEVLSMGEGVLTEGNHEWTEMKDSVLCWLPFFLGFLLQVVMLSFIP